MLHQARDKLAKLYDCKWDTLLDIKQSDSCWINEELFHCIKLIFNTNKTYLRPHLQLVFRHIELQRQFFSYVVDISCIVSR